MKVYIKGLNSCVMRRGKLTQYERWLQEWGHEIVDRPAEAERILIWSCGFRGDVRDNSLERIAQFESDYPAALVITAGCLPDIDRELVRGAVSGPLVSWKNDFSELEELFGQGQADREDRPHMVEPKLCDNAGEYRRDHPGADVQFHDEFIKLLISEGCEHTCTYCSERLAFPPYRSFAPELLVMQANQMVKATGDPKIVLVADSLGQYGCDIGSSLPALIRELCASVPRARIALNNLNPADFIKMFDEMVELIGAGMLEHINLPIQSASDRVLKRMNRAYRSDDIARIFAMFRQKNFYRFDTHVILGFPGEDEVDYLATESFVKLHRPAYVLASQYMESPGMPSARLDNHCASDVVKERCSRFFSTLSAAGIICNIERGEIVQERLERLNIEEGA